MPDLPSMIEFFLTSGQQVSNLVQRHSHQKIRETLRKPSHVNFWIKYAYATVQRSTLYQQVTYAILKSFSQILKDLLKEMDQNF